MGYSGWWWWWWGACKLTSWPQPASLWTTSHNSFHCATAGLCDVTPGEGATGVRVLGLQTHTYIL